MDLQITFFVFLKNTKQEISDALVKLKRLKCQGAWINKK